jgi:hypothetical protein
MGSLELAVFKKRQEHDPGSQQRPAVRVFLFMIWSAALNRRFVLLVVLGNPSKTKAALQRRSPKRKATFFPISCLSWRKRL